MVLVDGSDFRFPADYYVRVYNDKLTYRQHYVSAYKTDAPNTLIYTIHKLLVNVVIQLVDAEIYTTYIGENKGTFKLSANTDVEELLKIALSSALDKPVTLNNKAQLTLF